MSNDPFSVRAMTREELDIAIDWAAAEGWNPGLYDADAFFATDPNGFLLGELNGDPIASISAVAYDDTFGFLGLYIVHPEFRGQGYGKRIWDGGLTYLGDRNVGLDGVVAQQDNYKRSGFALAYRNERYEGVGGGERPADAVPLDNVPVAQVLAYDTECFALARAVFLKRWLRQPNSAAFAVIDNGRLSGYGMIRICRRGYKIGPLFADTPQVAETLFSALAATAPPGDPIFLDVPQLNPAALALVKRHAMTPVFETARMYTKSPPKLPINRIYGVTTFELG